MDYSEAQGWIPPLDRRHVVAKERFRNKILQTLDEHEIERLCLRPVKLEVMHEMEYPGSAVEHIFFVEEGVASQTVTLQDGSQVEAGMFGYEAAIGVSALMGVRKSLNRVYMQIPGRGFMSPIECARREFERMGTFHSLALRYVQMQVTLSAQTTACNTKHEVEKRLARWLLICADRAAKDHFEISQEFLSEMLGTARPSVSIAAGHLKQKGLIEYSRGTVRILDAKRLESHACECYLVVKEHLDNFLEFDTGYVI